MATYDEVHNLEVNIFNSIEAAYKAISVRDRDNAKAYIASVEVLNEEYKEITQIDCVKPENILRLYEKLWEVSNA